MNVDVHFANLHIGSAAEAAADAEAARYDALWTSEAQGDPFLPLAVAAASRSRLFLGTAIATAFTRSPMVTAMIAWELQRASGGRFFLGLGTQVRAHNARRFSVASDRPSARMREMVHALRHIWGAFQGNWPLGFEGDFYSFNLLTPMFNPGPCEHAKIPVLLAAVGPRMYSIAGEVADGVLVHPFHSIRYLREVALPSLTEGMQRSGQLRRDFTVAAPVFCIVGFGEERERARQTARRQIAFYASTSSYRGVLETHGLGELQGRLASLARRNAFDDMTELVGQELVSEIAVEADSWPDAAQAIRDRYEGVLDRVSLYAPLNPPRGDDLRHLVRTLNGS